jgi:hypothetical protein
LGNHKAANECNEDVTTIDYLVLQSGWWPCMGWSGQMSIPASYNTYAARIPEVPWINLQFILAKKE